MKRDEEHPFIVKSSDFQVTALGTEFNVTAYPDEDEVTATLISGKVLVEYNGQKNQEVLNPNEQLEMCIRDSLLVIFAGRTTDI